MPRRRDVHKGRPVKADDLNDKFRQPARIQVSGGGATVRRQGQDTLINLDNGPRGGGGSGMFHYSFGDVLPALATGPGLYFHYLTSEDNTWMMQGGQNKWTSAQYTSDLGGLPGDAP